MRQELKARLASQYRFLTHLAQDSSGPLGPAELEQWLLRALELAEDTLLEFNVYGERWAASQGSVISCRLLPLLCCCRCLPMPPLACRHAVLLSVLELAAASRARAALRLPSTPTPWAAAAVAAGPSCTRSRSSAWAVPSCWLGWLRPCWPGFWRQEGPWRMRIWRPCCCCGWRLFR